jgi:hypothetical protein
MATGVDRNAREALVAILSTHKVSQLTQCTQQTSYAYNHNHITIQDLCATKQHASEKPSSFLEPLTSQRERSGFCTSYNFVCAAEVPPPPETLVKSYHSHTFSTSSSQPPII